MLKTIDRLLVKSFIPPFMVAFCIALFVFIMQYLWLYIDDIVGKGVSFFLILELVFYLSLSLVPLALPIGVLLASVMLFGNLSERYELSSLKTAGISLMRIMRPLMWTTIFISIFSFVCSNYLIPVAKLKFHSRLHDIRTQKPALSIEKGIFNRDFQGYVIRVGDKDPDNRNIQDVLIYDHVTTKGDEASIILADRGEMFTVEEENLFVMKLYDGTQYQDVTPAGGTNKKSKDPFIRTNFKTWTKVFDMGEFEINRTDEEDFKSHQYMMSAAQLRDTIKGLNQKISDVGLSKEYNFGHMLNIGLGKLEATEYEKDRQKNRPKSNFNPNKISSKKKSVVIQQKEEIDDSSTFIDRFEDKDHRLLVTRSKSKAKSAKERHKNSDFRLNNYSISRSKYTYELHWKYCMAAVCFIFLFIGAPMGAIIRKGGYGYPLLVSIVFFMIFIMLSIACRKLAHGLSMNAILAGWLPGLILFPIGLFLTDRAMKDRKLLDVDVVMSKFITFFKKQKPESHQSN
jgi:lipopolysaccharide export system permease protein